MGFVPGRRPPLEVPRAAGRKPRPRRLPLRRDASRERAEPEGRNFRGRKAESPACPRSARRPPKPSANRKTASAVLRPRGLVRKLRVDIFSRERRAWSGVSPCGSVAPSGWRRDERYACRRYGAQPRPAGALLDRFVPGGYRRDRFPGAAAKPGSDRAEAHWTASLRHCRRPRSRDGCRAGRAGDHGRTLRRRRSATRAPNRCSASRPSNPPESKSIPGTKNSNGCLRCGCEVCGGHSGPNGGSGYRIISPGSMPATATGFFMASRRNGSPNSWFNTTSMKVVTPSACAAQLSRRAEESSSIVVA